MAHFRIEGLPPFDGDHPIDFERFTNAEFHTIKQISGVRAGEIGEAFEAGDTDLIVAFCAIALERAGHVMSKDAVGVLWKADVGKITLVAEDEAGDAGPPEQPPSAASVNEKTGSSGDASSPAGGSLASGPSRTGVPSSDASVPSGPEILAR